MQEQVLSPGVQDRDHADLSRQMFRIGCDLQQGLRAGGVTMRPSRGEALMERSIRINNCFSGKTRFWQGFPGENQLKSHRVSRIHRQR
jgi:hypothetical protein